MYQQFTEDQLKIAKDFEKKYCGEFHWTLPCKNKLCVLNKKENYEANNNWIKRHMEFLNIKTII